MVKNGYKVSVIIMTFKKFDSLEKNLLSIKNQIFKNYEVILSDDSSPNFNYEKINSLFTNIGIKNYKIISNKWNLGTVKNYNNAIKESSGEIIIPLSQDDCFINEYILANIVDFLADDDHNICLGLRKGNKSGKIFPCNHDIKIAKSYDSKKILNLLARKNIYSGSSLYFKKVFFNNIGEFDESCKLVEDYSFAIKCIQNSEKIYILDYPTVFYGEEGVSSSNKNNLNSQVIKDIMLTNKKLYLDEHNLSLKAKRHIELQEIRNSNINKFKKTLYYLCYIDVATLMVLYKIFKW